MHQLMLAGKKAVNTRQLKKDLVSLGYDVVGTAETGSNAVKMAKGLKPDLVLMDIALPGRPNGIGAAERISRESDIPIVFLTADTDGPLVDRAKDVTPLGYILKPFQEWQVKTTIEMALHRRDMERQIQDAADRLESQVAARTKTVSSRNARLQAEMADKEALIPLLKHRAKELEEKVVNLKEANTAMELLLSRRDQGREDLEDKVMLNIRELVIPYIGKLRASDVTEKQSIYIDIIESNINNATMPIVSGMSDVFLKLTPTEIKVANLLKQGKVTKDIADLMGLSPRTIEAYRSNIRKKFDIKSRNINLRTFLISKH